MEFKAFPKIGRYGKPITVTEKIDGTNAQVMITEDGEIFAGSRNRWITPEADNFGFAKWVQENKDELLLLGPGHHYGEWWGQGIQRGYGLTEKRFSLFNVHRWNEDNVPGCCHVVPIVYSGESWYYPEACLEQLEREGSLAAPGYMYPEGIMLYFEANGMYLKFTVDNFHKGK